MQGRATIGARRAREVDLPVERPEVRLGFVALTDCAPLVIAKERGFFRRHGLRVTLERQASWATVRDKLAAGVLDGSQMLAPMALASSLGLDDVSVPLIAPMSLGLGGNAVTVSPALYRRMWELRADAMDERPRTAAALKAVIDDRRARGAPLLRFAVVYPFSAHHYELAYWMAAAGIDPMRDVELSVIPPASMVSCLDQGHIDGYCVGEPWNQHAVVLGVGRSVVTKAEIWGNSPEKVLAVGADWADRNPETLRALLRALVEACAWADPPTNRLETVHVIAGESYVDAPVEVLRATMTGYFRFDGRESARVPDFHVFSRYAATFPWISHAAWFLTQMVRWGQVEKPFPVRNVAASVYRPDIYREVAEDLGIAVPDADEKREGAHAEPWELETAGGAIAMGADPFIDGRVFDARSVLQALESYEISAMRVRLDDLVGVNP